VQEVAQEVLVSKNMLAITRRENVGFWSFSYSQGLFEMQEVENLSTSSDKKL